MKAIVMAAGKGTRLQEKNNPMPKVLKKANGRPLLDYVLDAISFIDKKDITVVTGFMHEMVEDAFKDYGVRFIKQGDDAYGTGYAVMCGLKDSQFDDYDGDIFVINGDAPLSNFETCTNMAKQQEEENNDCTLLACVTDIKLPYGRLIRDEKGNILDIREEKECSEEEKKIKELNVGAYVFKCPALREALKNINNNNNAGEYYVTDVPPAMAKLGYKVQSYNTTHEDELFGVNTPEDLIEVEKILNSKK